VQDAKEVSRGLETIAALLRFDQQPKFKLLSYERAAQVVDTLGDELGPLVEQDRLRELSGIGPSLSRQIQELWNSGTSEYLTRLLETHPEGAADLVRVPGMTPKRIRTLHTTLGIRSIEDLLEACRAGRVRAVPGFGEKTEQRLQSAVEAYLGRGQEAPEPMLLSRALELAALIERELRKAAKEVHLAGALRRGEETVSEIEFVVEGDVPAALEQVGRLRQVLRVDAARQLAYLTGGLRLKVHGAAGDVGSTLFLATGSDAHVEAVRARVSELGRPLERGFQTERELYAALGLSFVPAELRQGQDELTRAATEDFTDLVELGDVRGMIHCHTTYSDGKNSIEEMALAAHALGMQYITITDHSPSAHYAGGVTLDRLKQQWDEIAAAQERVPIRILRGTESDILSDGSLDFPDAVLERFDVLIASIHARHRMDRDAMTRRLERALSLPLFKIWGHALGRILNHRAPIDCDVEAVLDALAGSRGAIEINADPHRLDLPPAWIPAARARGLPFVISVDAHSTHGLGVLRYGITMARRGGLRKREVLNTEPADDFAARVRPV
jgi:DNA polymerase (family 10)